MQFDPIVRSGFPEAGGGNSLQSIGIDVSTADPLGGDLAVGERRYTQVTKDPTGNSFPNGGSALIEQFSPDGARNFFVGYERINLSGGTDIDTNPFLLVDPPAGGGDWGPFDHFVCVGVEIEVSSLEVYNPIFAQLSTNSSYPATGGSKLSEFLSLNGPGGLDPHRWEFNRANLGAGDNSGLLTNGNQGQEGYFGSRYGWNVSFGFGSDKLGVVDTGFYAAEHFDCSLLVYPVRDTVKDRAITIT